jgi:spore germination cell wall hydrolase CwlJ-like protein
VKAVVGDDTYTCKVVVKKPVLVNGGKSKTIVAGKSATLKVTGTTKATWYLSAKKSSNKSTSIAKLSNKKSTSVKVTAKKAGTCYLRAKVSGKYYTCKITVKKASASSTKKSYTDYELYLLSHLIGGEAGANWCTDAQQLAVGSVVLNRMKDSRFPNTLAGVIYQKGQYACTWDGNFDRTPTARTIANAKYLLEHGSTLPSNVVFQSNFKQGNGVYAVLGNLYFCY